MKESLATNLIGRYDEAFESLIEKGYTAEDVKTVNFSIELDSGKITMSFILKDFAKERWQAKKLLDKQS